MGVSTPWSETEEALKPVDWSKGVWIDVDDATFDKVLAYVEEFAAGEQNGVMFYWELRSGRNNAFAMQRADGLMFVVEDLLDAMADDFE